MAHIPGAGLFAIGPSLKDGFSTESFSRKVALMGIALTELGYDGRGVSEDVVRSIKPSYGVRRLREGGKVIHEEPTHTKMLKYRTRSRVAMECRLPLEFEHTVP
jgi:hypothetical protein